MPVQIDANSQRVDRIVVLFSPELGKRIRDLAERERRPLTAQIQVLVERALAMDGELVA